MLPHLAGDGFRHGDHACLGAAVDRFAPLPDAAGVGTDRDDPAVAALDHLVEDCAHAVDEAPDIDRDLALPFGARLLHEEAVDRPAGAVDQHVDTAHRALDEVDGRGNRVPVGDIGVPRHDGSRGRLSFDLPGLRIVHVRDHHAGAFGGESEGDRPAEVRRPTGDDHDLPAQPEIYDGTAVTISRSV